MKIILASNSPRRKQLLLDAGVNFKVVPSTCEEVADKTLGVEEYAKALSKIKVLDVLKKYPDHVVIGADTVVALNGVIFGKPKNRQDALDTLSKLSNKTHLVITGYTIAYKKDIIVGAQTTFVTFNNLTSSQIQTYVDEMRPFDKAGSYGIQDGYPLINKIEGDYNNVMGLPTKTILKILAELK